uniref:Uncharacterized protein n=1 Tax=Oryza glumipatula TaxID=40148 RepID=A0A0E0BCF3_9ORYZ
MERMTRGPGRLVGPRRQCLTVAPASRRCVLAASCRKGGKRIGDVVDVGDNGQGVEEREEEDEAFNHFHIARQSNFLGGSPLARYFAAASSAFTTSSPRRASVAARFSSAALCTFATPFISFSTCSAFFLSSDILFSVATVVRRASDEHERGMELAGWRLISPGWLGEDGMAAEASNQAKSDWILIHESDIGQRVRAGRMYEVAAVKNGNVFTVGAVKNGHVFVGRGEEQERHKREAAAAEEEAVPAAPPLLAWWSSCVGDTDATITGEAGTGNSAARRG